MTRPPGSIRFTREDFVNDDRVVHHGDPNALPDLWFGPDFDPSTPGPQRFSRGGNLETHSMDSLALQTLAANKARDKALAENAPEKFAMFYEQACDALRIDGNARCKAGPEHFAKQVPSRPAPKPTREMAAAFAIRDQLLAEGSRDKGGSLAARFQRALL